MMPFKEHPRGAAAVMFGLMLPVFIGFAALSVDTSMVAVARSQSSTAGDAAALAGAFQLATENRVRGGTNLSTEITAANNQAVSFGTSNRALGTTPILNSNASNQSGGQILVGYLNPTNAHS